MDTVLTYIALIEPRLLRHVTGKPGHFIAVLRSDTYLNEDAFCARICGEKNSPSYYRTLKSRTLKILQALGLSFTKVDLLDIEANPLVDFKETIYDNTIRTIVFFGEKSGKDFLPKLGLPLYKAKTLKNIQFIYSENLSIVSQNKENQKRKLWDVLKETFQN